MRHDHDHGPEPHHEHPVKARSGDEYHRYVYLFAVGFVSASGEFLVALIFAHSMSAQADAIHALTHLLLYGLAFWVSRQVLIRQMGDHEEGHYREQFTYVYAGLVFAGLGWVIYNSIAKLFSAEGVISGYMFLSVSIGLSGNIIALTLLNSISKIHGAVADKSRPYRWLHLDTWGDFSISVIVLATSLIALAFPSLPLRFIDPVISLGAALWIGWSGVQIFRSKTFCHLHR